MPARVLPDLLYHTATRPGPGSVAGGALCVSADRDSPQGLNIQTVAVGVFMLQD